MLESGGVLRGWKGGELSAQALLFLGAETQGPGRAIDQGLQPAVLVGQVLDPHSRTVSARAVIDNPDRELKPGMFVYANIEGRSGSDTAPLRLAVPTRAVASVEERDVVFVEAAERSFEIRHVELGEASGDWVEILSGLSEEEPIAVTGVFTLKSEVQKGGLEGHDH